MNFKTNIAKIWNVPSRIGEGLGWEWLIYNPGVFFEFAMVARRNSPLFVSALVQVFAEAKTFCDVGSGTGQFVRELRRLGRNACGFEYSMTGRFFSRLIGAPTQLFDLGQTPAIQLSERVDLVFSLEVGEH